MQITPRTFMCHVGLDFNHSLPGLVLQGVMGRRTVVEPRIQKVGKGWFGPVIFVEALGAPTMRFGEEQGRRLRCVIGGWAGQVPECRIRVRQR